MERLSESGAGEQAEARARAQKTRTQGTHSDTHAHAHTQIIERITLSLHAAYTAAAGPNTITIYTANEGDVSEMYRKGGAVLTLLAALQVNSLPCPHAWCVLELKAVIVDRQCSSIFFYICVFLSACFYLKRVC